MVIFNLTTNQTNEVKVADFNFDGYPDISVLRDSGTEKYYDIYLFQEKAASFLIRREGRSCDPGNGDEFRYSEIYGDGKPVERQNAPLNKE